MRTRIKKSSHAVRELRKALGHLSQEQFAHELGTSGRTISRWEAGSEPTGENLTRLMDAAEKVSRADLKACFADLKAKAVSESLKSLLSAGSARRIPYAELRNIQEVVQTIMSELHIVADETNREDLRLLYCKVAYIDDWLNTWIGGTRLVIEGGKVK